MTGRSVACLKHDLNGVVDWVLANVISVFESDLKKWREEPESKMPN